ncbi:MAG: glycosyltransferase, partial [Elusimicrobiota bacterium]|nr:glycosyltransferase [Elusimicrobiota bacterium]
MTKVSVVIDNHNYGRFLNETLDSVLTQVLDNSVDVEIVVVDDGSTDDSREILSSYA